MEKVRLRQSTQPALDLPAQHFQGLTGVTFGQRFAHTNNRVETAVHCRTSFLLNPFVGLAEILPALGMSDDRVGAACIQEHSYGNLTRESSLFFPMDILRGDRDTSTVGLFDSGWQSREWRRHHDVAMFDVLDLGDQGIEKCARLRASFEHFPVASNNGASHLLIR